MQANLQMRDINAPQKSNMDTWVKRNYSNGTILIEVVEGRSKWKYICMTLLWHLALELVGMRRWFPKNGDSPESQDEINLWVKSAADLWCCSNISKYEQISWKYSSLEEKTMWTYSHDMICWDRKHQEISCLTTLDIIFWSFIKKTTSNW